MDDMDDMDDKDPKRVELSNDGPIVFKVRAGSVLFDNMQVEEMHKHTSGAICITLKDDRNDHESLVLSLDPESGARFEEAFTKMASARTDEYNARRIAEIRKLPPQNYESYRQIHHTIALTRLADKGDKGAKEMMDRHLVQTEEQTLTRNTEAAKFIAERQVYALARQHAVKIDDEMLRGRQTETEAIVPAPAPSTDGQAVTTSEKTDPAAGEPGKRSVNAVEDVIRGFASARQLTRGGAVRAIADIISASHKRKLMERHLVELLLSN